jgi:hypothetical protein
MKKSGLVGQREEPSSDAGELNQHNEQRAEQETFQRLKARADARFRGAGGLTNLTAADIVARNKR